MYNVSLHQASVSLKRRIVTNLNRDQDKLTAVEWSVDQRLVSESTHHPPGVINSLYEHTESSQHKFVIASDSTVCTSNVTAFCDRVWSSMVATAAVKSAVMARARRDVDAAVVSFSAGHTEL